MVSKLMIEIVVIGLLATSEIYSEEKIDWKIKVDKTDSQCLILKLPYKIHQKNRKIFAEETENIIIIEKIEVEGKTIAQEPDYETFEPYLEYKTINSRGKDISYSLMVWEEGLTNKNELFYCLYNGKRYVIHKGDKNLKIKYRVLFPFPFMNSLKIFQKKYQKKYLSEEYIVEVDLSDYW